MKWHVRIRKKRKRGWEIATIGENRKEEGLDVDCGGVSFHYHVHFLLLSLFFQLSIVTYLVRIRKKRKRGWMSSAEGFPFYYGWLRQEGGSKG